MVFHRLEGLKRVPKPPKRHKPCDLAGNTASSTADTCQSCTAATAIGRDAHAYTLLPRYARHRQFNRVARRANSALGATQPLNQENALTARSPAARLVESRVETRRGRVGDATETNML